MAATDSRGFALVDVLAATGLAMVLMAMAVAVIGGTLDRERTLTGAQYLAGQVQRARFEALKRSTAVALQVILVGDRTSLRLFADGNGNGVLQRDIDRGADSPISELDWLDVHARGVSLRVNQRVADIGGAGWIDAGDDPVRIGRTSLVTFSALGSSTSGTLYVATAAGPQMAVRLFGATGRLRVLRFNGPSGQWLP